MIIKEITDYLETFFPLTDAYDWDHCGLQVGSTHEEVKSITTTLRLDGARKRSSANELQLT